MNIFAKRLEPQPLILPGSKCGMASQATVVDYPAILRSRSSARCRCGYELEPGNRFCGGCGARLRNVWFVSEKGGKQV